MQFHAVEPGFAVHFFGGYQAAQQGLAGTGIHGENLFASRVANDACIGGGVVQAHVAGHYGERHKINQAAFGLAVCHQNGGGIILAGVGVDNQADFFRHIDFLRLGWFGAAIIVLINAALVEAGILCQKTLVYMPAAKAAINIRANSTVFMAGHAGVENESVTQPIQRYNTAFMFKLPFQTAYRLLCN